MMYLFLIILSFQVYNKITFIPVEIQPIAEYTQIAAPVRVDSLVKLHNDYRVSKGLNSLTVDNSLNKSAQAKADDMCTNNYWAHTSPTGVTPWYWISNAGYDYDRAGENLARKFSTDQGVFNAWLNSPTHLANVVGDYKNIGVGRNSCGGVNYIVIHFGTLVGE